MKNTKQLISLSILLVTIFIAGCKKNNDTTVVTPPPPNVLCNGNSTTSFYPFKNANQWTYNYSISSASPVFTITGTHTYNSLVYYEITDASHVIWIDPIYLREDATTHNIYRYDNNNTNSEFLLVPGNPTLNQTWTDIDNHPSTVTDLNASINTGSCSYTGLLKITSGGTHTLYYKRGLGLVYDIDTIFITAILKLTAVTLH